MYSTEKRSEIWRGTSLKVFAILVIGFLMLSMMPPSLSVFEQPTRPRVFERELAYEPPTTLPEVAAAAKLAPSEKIHSILQPYLETGEVPANVLNTKSGMGVLIFGTPTMDVEAIREIATVRSVANLGYFTYVHAAVDSQDALLAIAAVSGVAEVTGNVMNLEESPVTESSIVPRIAPGDSLEYYNIEKIVEADKAQLAGFTGTDIVVAIHDTGVDFGLLDLNHSQALDTDGYPLSFDAGGFGLISTEHPMRTNGAGEIEIGASVGALGVLRPAEPYGVVVSQSIDSRVGFGFPYVPGVNWRSIKVDEYESLSGNYMFGITYVNTNAGNWFIFALAVDDTNRGEYTHLIIDWRASYIASAYYSGFNQTDLPAMLEVNFDNNPYITEYDWWKGTAAASGFSEEWTLSFDMGNGSCWVNTTTGVPDFGPMDGFPDISIGAMANTYDVFEVFDGGLVEGLDPAGRGFAAFWDGGGTDSRGITHGTWCAIAVAGNGNAQYPNWLDDKLAPQPKAFPGVAPDAKIMGVSGPPGVGMSSSVWEGFFWAAGFRMDASGEWVWPAAAGDVYRADIISNSWGPGYDVYSNFLSRNHVFDIIATPDSMFVDYPGLSVIFSQGNSGQGYSTMSGIEEAASVICVGASTNLAAMNDVYGGPESSAQYNTIAEFTSKGPQVIGVATADIIAPGYGDCPSGIMHLGGNGTAFDPYRGGHDWSGTSLAAPVGAAVLALAMDAYYTAAKPAWDSANLMIPDMGRSILMSTATDLGSDPFTQGAGQVNASAATELALEISPTGGTPSNYAYIWSNSTHDNMLTQLGEYFADQWTQYGLDYNVHMGYDYANNLVEHTSTSMYYGIWGSGTRTERLEWMAETAAPAIEVYEYKEVVSVYKTFFMNYTEFTTIPINTSEQDDWGTWLPDPYVGYNFSASPGQPWTDNWRTFVNLSKVFTQAEWNSIFAGNGSIGMYVSADYYLMYQYLHDWQDPNGDGLINYANPSGTVQGELPRVNAFWALGQGDGVMWLNPATTFAGTPLLRIYDYSLYAQAGADITYSIELVRYDKVKTSWASVTTGAGYADITVDASAAPYGYTQAVVEVKDTADTTYVPLSFGRAYTVGHVSTAAPINVATGTPYDYQRWVGGDMGSHNARILPIYVTNASATTLFVNITDVTPFWDGSAWLTGNPLSADYSMDIYVTDNDVESSGSASTSGGSVAAAIEMEPGADIYWLHLQCYSGMFATNTSTARAKAEFSVGFALNPPTFVATVNGLAFPADQGTVGMMSDYENWNCTIEWSQTSAEFQALGLGIASATASMGAPPIDVRYEWTFTTSDPTDSWFFPRDAPGHTGTDYWELVPQTSVYIEVGFDAGTDCDAFFWTYPDEFVSWGIPDLTGMAMGTSSNPETWSGNVAAAGNYWIQVWNYDGIMPKHAYVRFRATPPSEAPVSATGDTVVYDTRGKHGARYLLSSTATDTWGFSHTMESVVLVNNIPPAVAPEVSLATTLDASLSGDVPLTIFIYDWNNNNTETPLPVTGDDTTVWLHLYYSMDEAARYLQPIITYIDATAASANRSLDITYTWDTTRAINTAGAVARLWLIADDGTTTTTYSSPTKFEIINAGGAGAGAGAENSQGATPPILVGLLALLGIGAIPVVCKLLRIRRR